MCQTAEMLTKEDKKYIDNKIDNLDIIIQSGFQQIMETKANKVDVDKVENNLTRRIDILEYKIVGGQIRRLDKIEDEMRIVKSKLNLN